ncbi:hypothetical protein [Oceanobacillus damuensis]|uniref:hypothetical protein n=1 Tax=Oceanobacillus damuensis TaxID=937928 RepID=UPI0012ED1BD2|nr:hypothetical protein [Oceanobacillus damuensis]
MSNDEKLSGRKKFDIIVESGLQLIPTVGGPLATAYFGTKNEKRFKRIESFYEEFSRQMQEIDYRFKSIKSHDEDALIAIIERLNEKIEQEVLEKKRSYFKNFLKHTLSESTNKNNFDERRYFIDTLADMTLLEVELLNYLKSIHPDMTLVGSINKPGVEQPVIVGAVGRIKNYGFINASQQSMTIGNGSDNALNQAISLNSFGQKFIGFCLRN